MMPKSLLAAMTVTLAIGLGVVVAQAREGTSRTSRRNSLYLLIGLAIAFVVMGAIALTRV